MKPRALDLFCGAGGATKGLQRAGFHVTGIDIKVQPRYCGEFFIHADALSAPVRLADFDFIWASPPCQAFSISAFNQRAAGKIYPDLIGAVRALLAASGALTAIENVVGAPLRRDLVLDGTMFPELHVIRRRIFELNFFALQPSSRIRKGLLAEGYSCVVGGGRCSGAPVASNAWHTQAAKQRAMDIAWMRRHELAQAIPPAYSEFIGRSVLMMLQQGAA